MNQVKKNLKAVAQDLKKLTQKTEKMIKRVGRLEKAQATKKPKAKAAKKAPAKKPAKLSASGTVLAIVKRSRKDIDIPTLEKKTGFEGRKMRDTIFRLKKDGKIKSAGRGIYVKA